MMKKVLLFVLLSAFIFLIPIKNIKADTGPKPTLKINVNYKDNKKVYVDVLIKHKGDYLKSKKEMDFNDNIYDIYDFLINYNKSYNDNEYYPYSIFNPTPANVYSNGNNTFTLGYIVPQEYKILIYEKDTNTVIVTEVFKKNGFNSKLDLNLNIELKENDINYVKNNEIVGSQNHEHLTIFVNYLIRIILTLLVELGLLYFVFKYKDKKSILLVLSVNIFTQSILTVYLLKIYYNEGPLNYYIYLFVSEFFIFLFESLIYILFLKKDHKKSKLIALCYGITANLLSVMLTLLPVIYL